MTYTAWGILTVTRQKHHTVIISPSELNKDGLMNPECHPCKEKLRRRLLGWSKDTPAGNPPCSDSEISCHPWGWAYSFQRHLRRNIIRPCLNLPTCAVATCSWTETPSIPPINDICGYYLVIKIYSLEFSFLKCKKREREGGREGHPGRKYLNSQRPLHLLWAWRSEFHLHMIFFFFFLKKLSF